ncbi:hypothetical protein NKH77_15830 [Streptomyces sp. M19]
MLITTGVAALVLLTALACALSPPPRGRAGRAGGRAAGGGRRGLRRWFGPEYELVVAGHAGDTRAAEKELRARLRRHGGLRPRPLTREQRGRYLAEWARIREGFAQAPPGAVAAADGLLARLAGDRGYPAGAYEEQVAALSVHHATSVQGYRQIHTAAVRAREGRAETEELSEALAHAHVFFRDLAAPRPPTPPTPRGPRAPRPFRGRGVATDPAPGAKRPKPSGSCGFG